MKNEIKYELRVHGNVFKIFETYTKKYIIEGTNRKEVANVTRFLNGGGAFRGNTPNFFINNGTINISAPPPINPANIPVISPVKVKPKK